VRIDPVNIKQTITYLQKIWEQAVPQQPFVYSFMDDTVKKVFSKDDRWAKMVLYSAVFSILIACLGAFGMISLILSQRVKEVGIRKVLGASVSKIATHLSKEFFRLILIANVLAWPLAFWLTKSWLDNFVYRIPLGISFFLIGTIVTMIIVFGSISILILKASKANPIDSLRYE
jgi:putative ABC transport system permease protein